MFLVTCKYIFQTFALGIGFFLQFFYNIIVNIIYSNIIVVVVDIIFAFLLFCFSQIL